MNEPTTGASLCKPPRKSVRQDVAKIVVPKLDDTQCGFFRGYSGAEQVAVFFAAIVVQNKFLINLLSSKFSRNPGSMPLIYRLHLLCSPR